MVVRTRTFLSGGNPPVDLMAIGDSGSGEINVSAKRVVALLDAYMNQSALNSKNRGAPHEVRGCVFTIRPRSTERADIQALPLILGGGRLIGHDPDLFPLVHTDNSLQCAMGIDPNNIITNVSGLSHDPSGFVKLGTPEKDPKEDISEWWRANAENGSEYRDLTTIIRDGFIQTARLLINGGVNPNKTVIMLERKRIFEGRKFLEIDIPTLQDVANCKLLFEEKR
ncbi:MAG: hypothetical protein ABH950_05725 [Candidatus Altiarchaeota archaeon]